MDFMETKYPHVDTMKALGIFEMWSWSQEHALGQAFSTTWNPTRSSLVSSSFNEVQGSSDQEPSLEICAQGTCQHLLCKEGTGTINEGELKFLDMGIKPILSRTSDGKRIRGDRSDTGNLMPSLTTSSPTRSQLTTLGTKEEESLVLEGSSHLSCVLLE
ncbi:unnamed protein product [Microthlaspi erraticum]|uniref:Arabidopsis retrotransposon Orf1 C-terminal domain-containing protein n=1 Tax=Microthlaspi erraticum TaxID=1685480 RepID=A0A6D2K8G4_9BRAS|nr:unnamed protein product [Microthlaspi erraticum]